MDLQTLYGIGVLLAMVGTVIMIIAAVLLFLPRKDKRVKVKGGGIILIGPIPIIFGTDKQSIKTVLLLAIILTSLILALVIILYFLNK